MITAERVVEDWLREQGFGVHKIANGKWNTIQNTTKWSYKEWRFYLYSNLNFTAYNIFNCSYMEVSLMRPESINKISDWIKGNKK